LDAGEWIRLVGCASEGIRVGSGHFGLLEEQLLSLGLHLGLEHPLFVIELFT
jgi:hypothetical protein